MADIANKEVEKVLETMGNMLGKSRLFNEAVMEQDLLTMTELYVDLEYDCLMLLSDTVTDPEAKMEIVQAALSVKEQAERSRFFPAHR
jgi:hypothetical protein